MRLSSLSSLPSAHVYKVRIEPPLRSAQAPHPTYLSCHAPASRYALAIVLANTMTDAQSPDGKDVTFDLAVIGAGIYGIQAARTYLEIHPNDDVVIFEADDDIGGVWSECKSAMPGQQGN